MFVCAFLQVVLKINGIDRTNGSDINGKKLDTVIWKATIGFTVITNNPYNWESAAIACEINNTVNEPYMALISHVQPDCKSTVLSIKLCLKEIVKMHESWALESFFSHFLSGSEKIV